MNSNSPSSYDGPIQKPGKVVIISSPSGGGKTSICRGLLTPERLSTGWQFSVSYTTRGSRPGEKDGVEYFFVGKERFLQLVDENFFAEHFTVHLYHYGTPRGPLEKVIADGGVMILDVDVQGARRLKEEYPKAVTIFIKPPSEDALRQRLERRGTETEEQLRVRFDNAREETKLHSEFDHTVVNDDLDIAIEEVLALITDRVPEG